ncbi:MAG: hypothetical protein ACPLRA_00895 [Candidatus Saccharicenans sp.]
MVNFKKKSHRLLKIINPFFLALFFFLRLNLSCQLVQQTQVDEVLEKVSQRLTGYPDFEKWQALVISTYIEADKNWRPEKTRRVKKMLTVNGEVRDEQIMEAVEIEKGQTRDVTESYRRQRLERLRKMKEDIERAKASGKKPNTKNQLTKDDLIPFSDKNKNNYVFRLVGEDEYRGGKVYILEARAKERKENLFEGRYYISQKTYDPLKLIVQPAKNPNFVKEFQVEIELEPWQDQLLLKKSRIKVSGGFLFKSVRILVEEEYSEFKVIARGRL